MSSNSKLGLIAGNGRFPILFAQAARVKNIDVYAAGVKGDTSFLLRPFVKELRMFNVGQLKDLFLYFQNVQVQKVIMAGQVNPNNLFDQNLQFDEEFKDLFAALRDRKADTIFSAVANRLKDYGLELIDSTILLKDYLAPKGTLTKHAPSVKELEDIQFGFNIAKLMGCIDVGQTVIIKEKAIVAIEAMEGTDQTILRGGKIAREGAVVVKTSKPEQDQRFDVPVVGPRTIEMMNKVRASCLGIEAGKTLIIDREKTIALANRYSISIVAA